LKRGVLAESHRTSAPETQSSTERLVRRVFHAASVVLALGTVACATLQPAQSPAGHAADASLADKVRLALNADPQLYARHVDVSVAGGVVHLGGYVWSSDEFTLARNDAASVPGVTAVDVQMQLMRGGMNK
jgi:osmotically-inducible protein OsmY